MTRLEENIMDLCVTDPKLSDHRLVSFRLETELVEQQKKKTVTYRKLKAINLQSFEKDLKNSELYQCESEDANFLANLYDRTLTDLLNKHAPEITKMVSDRQMVPWCTNTIGKLRRERRRLERQWKHKRTAVNLQTLKKAKNRVTDAIKHAKTLFYTKSIEDSDGDQKKLFQILNSLLHKKKRTFLPSGCKSLLPEKFIFFIQKINKIQSDLETEQIGVI